MLKLPLLLVTLTQVLAKDTLQCKVERDGVKRRRIRGMIILLPSPSPPYLSLSAIDANGRTDFPPLRICFPPFFLPSQPRTLSQANWILALPSSLLFSLPHSSTATRHCRFCACWDNASHKYHLARSFANIATDRSTNGNARRAAYSPLAAIDFPPPLPRCQLPPTAPQSGGV